MLALIPLLSLLAFGSAAFASTPAPNPPSEPTEAEAPPPDGSAPVDEAAAKGTPATGEGGVVDGFTFLPDPTKAAKIKHVVTPTVPVGFMESGLQEAFCKVRLYIDENGTVTQVVVVDCLEILQAPALAAAYATRFHPLLDENNVPIKVMFIINYKFVVTKPGKHRDDRRAARSARREGRR